MANPQGTPQKPIPAGYDVADWAQKVTAKVLLHIPKPERNQITLEQYHALAELCYYGERAMRGYIPQEQAVPYLLNLSQCLALEFGVTIEFMRLVRDKWGVQWGWRTNHKRLEKKLKPTTKPETVALALRDPALQKMIKESGTPKQAETAAIIGKYLGREVSEQAVKRGRRNARGGSKKRK